jgi:coenzyme Q-binding protein COQ10
MPSFRISRVLPHGADQLFAIAADVERYPDFLRWWQSAVVRQRSDDSYCTDQVVGFGPLTQRFTTNTTLRPPKEIEVTAIDGPFRAFHLVWKFEALPPARCRVALDAEVDLHAPLLQRLFDRAMRASMNSILTAFEDRARQLHGR